MHDPIKPDFTRILAEAHIAANQAARRIPDRGACGFAWVTVDGNSAISRFCRKMIAEGADGFAYGRRGYPRGWCFWMAQPTQAIDAKEAAAVAFRDVLAKYGIRADVHSRLD